MTQDLATTLHHLHAMREMVGEEMYEYNLLDTLCERYGADDAAQSVYYTRSLLPSNCNLRYSLRPR